ncbi:hypothetical protein D3C86_1322490 [compost metagenome]
MTGITSINITVGAGGSAGVAGGSSSFGSTLSATGGSGATGGASPVPGIGGFAAGSDLIRSNTLGAGGQRQLQSGGTVTSGAGGGDGGGGVIESAPGFPIGGNAALAYGCGGGGGVNGSSGGSGANGIVIVRW